MRYLQTFEQRLTSLEKNDLKKNIFEFICKSVSGVRLPEILGEFPDHDQVMDNLKKLFAEERIKYFDGRYTAVPDS